MDIFSSILAEPHRTAEQAAMHFDCGKLKIQIAKDFDDVNAP